MPNAAKTDVRVQTADFDVAAETVALTAKLTNVGAIVSFTGICRDEGGTLAAAIWTFDNVTAARYPDGIDGHQQDALGGAIPGLHPGVGGRSEFDGHAMAIPVSLLFALASAAGFILAIVIFSGIRERLDLMQLPKPLKGVPIALIVATNWYFLVKGRR